ncbi:MAG: hypothetical protein FWE19_00005, partial [Oscillospiraceae bacterium]|nr:hypothetical protein [Oscillospiraceae bacterium]
MRRFVFTVIAAILLLVLAGCSGEYHPKQLEVYADNGEAPAYLDDLQLPEVRPGQADFYEELREHGSLITAAFDFDEFSVWFAITPGYVYSQHLGVYEWNILHPTRPTIAAVVRNEGDRY